MNLTALSTSAPVAPPSFERIADNLSALRGTEPPAGSDRDAAKPYVNALYASVVDTGDAITALAEAGVPDNGSLATRTTAQLFTLSSVIGRVKQGPLEASDAEALVHVRESVIDIARAGASLVQDQ